MRGATLIHKLAVITARHWLVRLALTLHTLHNSTYPTSMKSHWKKEWFTYLLAHEVWLYRSFVTTFIFKSLTWIFVYILRRPRGHLGMCLTCAPLWVVKYITKYSNGHISTYTNCFHKLLKRIHSDTFVNHNTINTGYIHWCSHVAYIQNLLNLTNTIFNPLNPKLNPICYLLALLGAHQFLHVSRIRVKLLTFRLLMSYIYIWSTHSWCF